MRPYNYILNAAGEPVAESDLIKWGKWFETGDRRVKRETIGDCEVSTVFLGLDYRFGGDGGPILWETMIFAAEDHPLNQNQDRCSGNREQAEAMHERMCQKVRAAMEAAK